jgi:ankyrin repeat protein
MVRVVFISCSRASIHTTIINNNTMNHVISRLFDAAEANDAHRIKSIVASISKHIDINACTNTEGQTALFTAAINGAVDAMNVLLDAGACVNHVDAFGDTALIEAATFGHARAVRTLIAHGADVMHMDCNGKTAMYWAIHLGHVDVINALNTDFASLARTAANAATTSYATTALAAVCMGANVMTTFVR